MSEKSRIIETIQCSQTHMIFLRYDTRIIACILYVLQKYNDLICIVVTLQNLIEIIHIC